MARRVKGAVPNAARWASAYRFVLAAAGWQRLLDVAGPPPLSGHPMRRRPALAEQAQCVIGPEEHEIYGFGRMFIFRRTSSIGISIHAQ